MSDWLSFGWPTGLWGLAAIPLVLLPLWRSRLSIPRARLWLATACRVFVVLTLVLAVSDLRVAVPSKDLVVTTIIDGSGSVSPLQAQRWRDQLATARAEYPDVDWQQIEVSSEGNETDLSAALNLAFATGSPEHVRRAVLLTDGRQTTGDVLAAASRVGQAGTRVSVLPPDASLAADDVALLHVDAPRMFSAGKRERLQATVWTDGPREVQLNVVVDGESVDTVREQVDGERVVAIPIAFDDDGVHEVVIQLVGSNSRVPENDRWRALVRVAAPPRVLFVSSDQKGSVLARALDEAQLRVELGGKTLPTTLDPYRLVVIEETQLSRLSEDFQTRLSEWVHAGGSLVTITGGHAVGSEPRVVRSLEPIKPPRGIVDARPIELVLAIDRSGSMNGQKIAEARNAAAAAIDALNADARVGIVPFAGQVGLTLPSVKVADQRDEAKDFVSKIQSNGGTNIADALSSARAAMSNEAGYFRHVILLSDGVSAVAPALDAARGLARSGVSITAITIGPPNHLMSQIARIGHGRYHVTQTPSSLARLFVREARFRQPPRFRTTSFRPEVVTPMAFLDGINFEDSPVLTGHALAETREGAQMVLMAGQELPLLAHWYRGLGRVATFTSNTSGKWANKWRTDASFRKLWSQLAWDMIPPPDVASVDVRVDPHPVRDDLRVVTVANETPKGADQPRTEITRNLDEVAELSLAQVGPGLWRGDVPVKDGFLVEVLDAYDEPLVVAAADNPYPSELGSFGADQASLQAIATRGGGVVVSELSEVVANVERERVEQPVRGGLLGTALLSYLLGVLLLRLPTPTRTGRRKAAAPAAPLPEPAGKQAA
jgi:uncharacterized protein YegL